MIGIIAIAPTAAQALAWSTYADGYYSIGAKPSSSAVKVYKNRGRIYPLADGTVHTQRYDVLENKTKGKVLASTSGGTGVWITLNVPVPATNTKGRCYLVGPAHPLGAHHLCQVYK